MYKLKLCSQLFYIIKNKFPRIFFEDFHGRINFAPYRRNLTEKNTRWTAYVDVIDFALFSCMFYLNALSLTRVIVSKFI